MIARPLRYYRNAYGGLPRTAWLLAGVMFVNRCGTMVLPYLTLYLTQRLHFTVAQAGWVMGIYGLGALAGTYLGGRLTDRLGFHTIQVGSLLLAGMMLLSLRFLHDFPTICAGVFMFTLLGDTFRPANSVAIAHYSTPENRTRAYSLNRLAINLGWSIGGGMGGVLAAINYDYLFWADGFTCLAAGLLLWLTLKPAPAAEPGEQVETPAEVAQSPYHDRLYLAFMAFLTLFAIGFFQLFSTLPLYLKEVHGLNEAQIGLLTTFNGLLIVAVEMALIYELEKKQVRRTTAIQTGAWLMGAAYLVFNLVPYAAIALVSTVLYTFGEMLTMPFMQTVAVERSGAANRGQYLGLYSMGFSFAQITAPSLGAQLASRAGFTTLWYVIAGICLVAGLGFRWLRGRLD